MKNILEYKGYHTKVEVDMESMVAYGKIEGINDLVTFETKNLSEVTKEFENAVDDYLEFCKEVGKAPDKEYKGTFNVRISPKLHKELAMLASKNGESLNQTVEKAIQSYVSGVSQTEINVEEIYTRMIQTMSTHSEDMTKYGSDFTYDGYGIDKIRKRQTTRLAGSAHL